MNFSRKKYRRVQHKNGVRKTRITLVLMLALTVVCWAQNGINYKAVVTDATGNLIVSGPVIIQFDILETSASGTIIYSEEHTTMTDANGLIIVTIGEGSVNSGTFNAIDWRGDRHFLNVQIDIDDGSGFVNIDTTEFKSVPYALNVTGLEKLTEAGKTGWRLIGRDPADYGDIGNNAIDFSTQVIMPDIGATGTSAFAAGEDTYALGQGSVAFGLENAATNLGSFVGGFDSTSSGAYSFAFGNDANALGANSVAFGSETSATVANAFAIGDATFATGNNTFAMGFSSEAFGINSFATGAFTNALGINSFSAGDTTSAVGNNSVAMGIGTKVSAPSAMGIGEYNIDNIDALLMVGNGTGSVGSNALEVLRSGSIVAPSLTNTLINTTGDKALVTKEYVDSASATGLEAIDQGSGIGWRLIGRNPTNYGPIGKDAVDLSFSSGDWGPNGATGDYSLALGLESLAAGDGSIASGFRSRAFGGGSIAIGDESIANGANSIAMGFDSFANGAYSIGIGNEAVASGVSSFSMGGITFAADHSLAFGEIVSASGKMSMAKGGDADARGDYSTVIGQDLLVDAYNSFVIGRYNVGGGDRLNWIATDPLFEIGNGASAGAKTNALTVLKNGKTGIGTATPTTSLHVNHPSGTTNNGLSISNVFDSDRWHFYTWTTNDLFLYFNNVQKASIDDVSGTYTALSDRHAKRNISSVKNVLDGVMQMEVVDYNFKDQKDQRKYVGLIAQDVEKLFPHLVYKQPANSQDSNEDTYTVDYAGFGVLAIKALQEQQKIIEDLKARIEALEKR